MGKEALVIERNILFKGNEFQGFLPIKNKDFQTTILENHSYHERGDALENNHNLQQIIPYIWIVNPLKKKVFLYKRKPNKIPDGEYKETRYLNKYSGGVGGHIDKDTEHGSDNPIHHAMMRELKEEVEMTPYPAPKLIGFLNDDSDDLGKVHFGIVSIAETKHKVKPKEESLGEGAFYSIEEAENLFSNPENEIESWTKLSWPFVKDYLSNS